MNTIKSVWVIILFSAAILVVACGPAHPPDLTPSPMGVDYRIPKIDAVSGYPEMQTKQEIVISAIPQSFEMKLKLKYECEWIRSVIGEKLNAQERDNKPDIQLTYLVKKIPFAVVEPDRLAFRIRISNKLARVLRLAGTIVAFQIDGKMVSMEKENFKEFFDGFVLPRQEAEYTITGPKLSTLPEKCNMALLLYDIITEVNAAGNPVKKANFEWFFTYEMETKSAPGTINKEIVTMTWPQAERMRNK